MLAEWSTHKEKLRRYVIKQTGDPDVADDILQDVYIKASQNIEQLASREKIQNWLYRITYNTIMDFYRSQPNYEPLTDDVVDEPIPSEVINLQSMAKCLRPMFDCLPEKYRQVMVLSELEELPQQVVAQQLGLSLSATKSRIQRGRVKLKGIVTDCCNVEAGAGGIVDYYPNPQCMDFGKNDDQ
ncbi:RNA polymerase sigma factor SigZ [Vibrio gallicus]|uniref:RNA polymerase sigma factor SigZ n=1 Tax=Vibrio gallicus TaxID=190897 RepID=UPI0021C3D3D3|nr:RNA polymerase sigma factor SigZ [Vibrio gallicus]